MLSCLHVLQFNHGLHQLLTPEWYAMTPLLNDLLQRLWQRIHTEQIANHHEQVLHVQPFEMDYLCVSMIQNFQHGCILVLVSLIHSHCHDQDGIRVQG